MGQSEILATMDLGSAADLAKGNLTTIMIAVALCISALIIRPIFVLIGMVMEDRRGKFSFSPILLIVMALALLLVPYHFSHPHALALLGWRVLGVSQSPEAACAASAVPCTVVRLSTSSPPPESSPRPSLRPADLRERYWQGPVVAPTQSL